MVTVNLVELHEIGNPERLAKKIHEWNPDLVLPIPVDDVARAVGITDIVADNTDGFEGVLVTNAEKSIGRIAYRASSLPERIRFTVGHEVGHFLMPTHTGGVHCTPDNMLAFGERAKAKSREAEANRFAAELLLPRRRFGKDLDAYHELDLKHALELAGRYGVSLEATLHRIAELSAHPCAVVFSVNGTIRYVLRNEFPWISVGKDAPLPQDSLSAKHRGALRVPSEMDAIDIGVWVEEPPARLGASLLEQVLRQVNGHQVTLLLLDDPDDDDEDDD